MKKFNTEKAQRRSFLKGAAVVGTAVGAGVLSAQALAEATIEKPKPVANKGYRETDHILEYYKAARF
jgi:hypothetical protein